MKPRFSIQFLLGATTLVALYVASSVSSYEPYHQRELTGQGLKYDNGIASVNYGIRRHKTNPKLDRLDFVVIQRSRGTTSQYCKISLRQLLKHREKNSNYEPGQIEIELSDKTNLHEIIDDKHRTMDVKIEPDVFLMYIQSGSTEPSLDALIKFAAEQKDAG